MGHTLVPVGNPLSLSSSLHRASGEVSGDGACRTHGVQQCAGVPGCVAMVIHAFPSEILPDPQDLRGQSLCHRPAEAGHCCTLPGHERLPQQVGRGGRERHVPGVRHPYQGAAVSGDPQSAQDRALGFETLPRFPAPAGGALGEQGGTEAQSLRALAQPAPRTRAVGVG